VGWKSSLIAASMLPCGCDRAPVTPEADTQVFQDVLDAWAAQPGHQGVQATVVFGDGESWTGVSGISEPGVPIQPGDLISIASITKTMTGALVLQLASEGRLSLDDSLGLWLPPHEYVDPAITLRQLLNHTAGLANYTASASLLDAVRQDPAHVFTVPELLGFLDPPHFAPGTDTEYTNTGFLLLGLVAEAATGTPILGLYRKRLWEPIGLRELYYPGHESTPPEHVAHARAGEEIVDPLSYPALITRGQSAAGLFSNARTVAAWGRGLFAGEVLTQAMQVEMRTLVPAAGNIPGESGAGLGIRSYGYLGRTQYGHSGGSVFGSSLLLYDPFTGVTVAVVMNQSGGADHFVLAPRLLEVAAAGFPVAGTH